MEPLLAATVGAFTGFGAGALFTRLRGRWWVSVPFGALGGVLGARLGAASLESALAESTWAAIATSSCAGGAVLALCAVAVHAALRRTRA